MTTTSDRGAADGEFRLTGRHVFAILLGAFVFVGGVNVYMISRAIGSFPGLVTESSYRDSQHFNQEIAAAQAQAGLGWKVDAVADRAADGRVTVRLEARDGHGAAISGVAFRATLQHPANRALDHVVALVPVAGASGTFGGVAEGVGSGKWGLLIEGDAASGRVFLSQNTLMFR